jgi:8-oxo-dGTP pyrophosphatase MutT (NUDIX family)
MSNTHTHDENVAWHNSLPAKHMAANMLCWNEKGELLFVMPHYDNWWLLPGGVVEAGESPLQAALRETKEELGLKLDAKRVHFVGINYAAAYKDWHDFVHFYFNAGVLTASEIKNIGHHAETLHGYQFLRRDQLSQHIAPHRLSTIEALFENNTRYGFYHETRIASETFSID